MLVDGLSAVVAQASLPVPDSYSEPEDSPCSGSSAPGK